MIKSQKGEDGSGFGDALLLYHDFNKDLFHIFSTKKSTRVHFIWRGFKLSWEHLSNIRPLSLLQRPPADSCRPKSKTWHSTIQYYDHLWSITQGIRHCHRITIENSSFNQFGVNNSLCKDEQEQWICSLTWFDFPVRRSASKLLLWIGTQSCLETSS